MVIIQPKGRQGGWQKPETTSVPLGSPSGELARSPPGRLKGGKLYYPFTGVYPSAASLAMASRPWEVVL